MNKKFNAVFFLDQLGSSSQNNIYNYVLKHNKCYFLPILYSFTYCTVKFCLSINTGLIQVYYADMPKVPSPTYHICMEYRNYTLYNFVRTKKLPLYET